MPHASIPSRPLSTTLLLAALWIVFYASFTLFHPALLDDADSVHAEVAREMLLRHDWITLYANGIRYLEKAPLLYWSMAASMQVSRFLGHTSANCLAVAARIPLALTVLALAFSVETFARRAFHSTKAGLYAALILLSSPGIFLFTRILLPDAMLCLWLTLAMLAFWQTEEPTTQVSQSRVPHPPGSPANLFAGVEPSSAWVGSSQHRLLCYIMAACCALGVLTKGLIGTIFPIAIVAIYLVLTRGLRGTLNRILELHPFTSTAVFLAIAAPWHLLAAWANPGRGIPGDLTFAAGHWQVPLPTDGNVHGWAWFYFVNEQLLRYLNLRVPRDYDTVPLWLFWGLLLIWLMPWSAFLFHSVAHAIRSVRSIWAAEAGRANKSVLLKGTASAVPLRTEDGEMALAAEVADLPRTHLLLLLWAALPLLFFSFSTRQEYYVLPALPALVLIVAGWLGLNNASEVTLPSPKRVHGAVYSHTGESDATIVIREATASVRITAVVLTFGTIFAAASLFFLLHTSKPAPDADLAALLQQNPGDYAMSMGHFLDLNAQALGLFRLPLALAALSLFLGPLASYLLRRRARPHAATLALAAGAFGFLLAAHLGLQTFAPVLNSQQLAAAIAPQVQADDLIVLHQEYEYGSTLGFYLQRPTYRFLAARLSPPQTTAPADNDHAEVALRPIAVNPIHILTDATYNGTPNYGRSSNLWYGSFFPDAPRIFETSATLAQKWRGPQRIFLWQDLAAQPSPLPAQLSPLYVVAKSGGKEIVSNQSNRTR